ncbi:MAG: hypothetical protein ACJAR1_001555 [Rubritalea sp.]
MSHCSPAFSRHLRYHLSMKDLHQEITSTILALAKQEADSSSIKKTHPIQRPISSLYLKDQFLGLFYHQHQTNAAFRNYCQCDQLHVPLECHEIEAIPALATDAFKISPNPTSLATDKITTTFLTSGTTTETKGSHHFSSLGINTYDTSIIAGWKHCQLPKLHQTLILTPSETEAPHSSLSHMMETIKRELAPSATFILSDGKLDHQAIINSAKNGSPLTLLGTALAFLQLFDILETLPPIHLPPGSWALETGGYKGTKRSFTKDQLYQKFQTHLGISADQIWNEYSMTELSSQFYTRGIGNPHIAPPWTRIKVINPETDLPVIPGEIGYLVIYDLANIDSVMGIRTQDLAIFHDSQSFTLIGRDPSALPRGCSRSL